MTVDRDADRRRLGPIEPEEGEFYSAEFYRHRPWLLRLSRSVRITVLVLCALGFLASATLGVFLGPRGALGVGAALAVCAFVVFCVGWLQAKNREPTTYE